MQWWTVWVEKIQQTILEDDTNAFNNFLISSKSLNHEHESFLSSVARPVLFLGWTPGAEAEFLGSHVHVFYLIF